jgi:hypothetical protein
MTPRWQHRSGGQVRYLDYTGSELVYSPLCVNNVLYDPRWQHRSGGQVRYLDYTGSELVYSPLAQADYGLLLCTAENRNRTI